MMGAGRALAQIGERGLERTEWKNVSLIHIYQHLSHCCVDGEKLRQRDQLGGTAQCSARAQGLSVPDAGHSRCSIKI